MLLHVAGNLQVPPRGVLLSSCDVCSSVREAAQCNVLPRGDSPAGGGGGGSVRWSGKAIPAAKTTCGGGSSATAPRQPCAPSRWADRWPRAKVLRSPGGRACRARLVARGMWHVGPVMGAFNPLVPLCVVVRNSQCFHESSTYLPIPASVDRSYCDRPEPPATQYHRCLIMATFPTH